MPALLPSLRRVRPQSAVHSPTAARCAVSVRWEGGRLVHAGFDDVYFNPADGLGESRHVFLSGNQLPARFSALSPGDDFVIGEAGFGTGRNFLASWRLFTERAPPGATLTYHAFEAWPLPFEVAARATGAIPELASAMAGLSSSWPLSIPGCAPVWTGDPSVRLLVWVGDIAAGLAEAEITADAWFLDGFTPSKNPEMWSEAVLSAIARGSRPGSTLATYTAAGWVRRGLIAAGFDARRIPGFNGKLHMLAATRTTAVPPPAPAGRAQRYPAVPRRPAGRIAVIGAGIAGCSTARALAEAGFPVTVFDASGVASGASGNPLGLVQPLPNLIQNPIGDWYSRAFVWARALAARLSLPWDPCGVTRIPTSAKKTAYIQRLLGEVSWPGVLAAGAGGSLEIHHAAIIQPIEWCHRLLAHARITLRAPHAIQDISSGPPWTLGGQSFDTVVLANSASAAALTPGLPLRWVRGQLGWVAATAASAVQVQALCHDGYLLPAQDGVHLIGATYHAGDTDMHWRDADWSWLQDRLRTNLPTAWAALGAPSEPLGGRVALRGVTPGRLPFVGPAIHPDRIHSAWQRHSGGESPWFGADGLRAGVWCTTGHGSRGLSSGPLSGAVLAAQLQGHSPPLPARLAEMIHPARACIQAAKRAPQPSASDLPD